MNKEQYDNQYKTETKIDYLKSIVVYNDDVNSFEHVISCFISILKHDMDKAVRCTTTVHFDGKCDVMSGSYEELEPYALALMNKKLSCKIE